MRMRAWLLLLVIPLTLVACGDDTGGTTGSTGGGSDELASFTAVAQDTDSGITVSIKGLSCNSLDGPYDVTIAAQGNATGETKATLELTNGKGTLDWSMDVTGAAEGTLSGKYAVELSPLQDTGVLLVTGVTTVETGSDVQTIPVSVRDVPVSVGTGVCPT